MGKIKVGFGFDVHQLKAGHPFVLGGVNLEHHSGAYGHSDADVLLHAICDALLGAANLRDIGYHFSNTDDRWKGISSLVLLQEVARLLDEKGWSIGNIDAMVCLEAPKINPHIPAMKIHIAFPSKRLQMSNWVLSAARKAWLPTRFVCLKSLKY